jgi:hypothetical protein
MTAAGQNAKYSLRADVFCFASKNRHRQISQSRPFRATTELMQRSKKPCLLDHLVGALTSVTGTVSPSAFAVLRLSDNSNLEA